MSSTACRPLAGFSLLFLSTQLLAAPAQSIEERLARLEARTSVAETRALVAEADAARLRKEVEQLNKQITSKLPVTAQASLNERVARIEANQQSLESPPLTTVPSAHSNEPPNDGFTFSGYARSGIMTDGSGAGHGGPYVTPAGSVGGAVGRLGNEVDTYMEAKFSKEKQASNGTHSKYTLMLADGLETPNDWTAAESSLNVRQVYAELDHLASFRDSPRFAMQHCGLASALIGIITTSIGSTGGSFSLPEPVVVSTTCI